MPIQRYTYVIELYQDSGTPAGRRVVTADWDPALQDAWLHGLRRGDVEPTDSAASSAVEPRWHSTLGIPHVEGFRVTILAEHGRGVTVDYSNDYFRREARTATAELLKEGKLNRGGVTQYLVLAYYDDDHPRSGPTSPFTTREECPELPLHESTLANFVDGSELVDASTGVLATEAETDEEKVQSEQAPADDYDAGDIPIVFPKRVLDEIRDLTRQNRTRETGGILIGNLHRDADVGEVFVEITAQIPATEAPSEVDRLSFTPETWTAVQAAIDLRGGREIYTGWYHSHLVREWCKECAPEKRQGCAVARGFLSTHDVELHRAVFARAYTCALVVSDVAEDQGLVFSLFGWRGGHLERRGYHVRNDRQSETAVSTNTGAEAGAKAGAAGKRSSKSRPSHKGRPSRKRVTRQPNPNPPGGH